MAEAIASVNSADGMSTVPRLLRELIEKIAGPNSSRSHLFPLCLRIITSRLGGSMLQDDSHTIETVKKRLAQQSRFHDAAVVAELYQRLMSKGTLSKPHALLRFLDMMSEQAAVESSSGVIYNPLMGSSTISDLNSLMERTRVQAGPAAIPDRPNAIHSQPQISVPPSTARTGSTITVDVRQPRSAPVPGPLIEFQKLDQAQTEVPEEYLIRDLVFVLHGVDGKYIRYDHSLDSFGVDAMFGIPRSVKDIVRRCTEVGWIYRRINNYLIQRASELSTGSISQSFCSTIKQDLLDYYRLVAVLESQLASSSVSSAPNHDETRIGSAMSLKRMFVWLQGPLQRLKALATLVDMCQGKKGGAILSVVHNHTNNGDPVIRDYFESILKEISKPILTMVKRWMFEGELQDPYQEFFVASDATVSVGEALWFSKYKLRDSMLPSFITKPLAEKILMIGKSINFMRYCCKDTKWIKDSGVQYYERNDAIEFGTGKLEKIVEQISEATNKRLVEIMFSKYRLDSHFVALKKYMLLGQGDFVQYLIDLLSSAVQKGGLTPTMAMRNLRQDFSSILESAIRGSNAQFDDPTVLDRLDVKMEDVRDSETILDIFSLEYHVDLPISVVLNEDAMRKYVFIFHSLWKLKRMEHCLASVWQSQIGMNRVLRVWSHLGPVFRRCQVLRAEMVHFVDNLNYYLMFEVLECSWQELLVSWKKSTDLDELIKAHDGYLNSIADNILLREMHGKETPGGLKKLFRDIFRVILQFHDLQRELSNATIEEFTQQQHREQQAELRAKQGKWGQPQEIHIPNTPYFLSVGPIRRITPTITDKIERLAIEYREHMSQFLQKVGPLLSHMFYSSLSPFVHLNHFCGEHVMNSVLQPRSLHADFRPPW
eukprot:TRINITY_DN2757_c0_g1_i1.p1 TRINITY_DN2757_c0_g1~~TRINITY_DN2757_c0_g1_i1.p1  ORF type:complete len:882 (+),score=144.03 TRINITY_DN2757_c0_g1_i1:59-2704(+)